MIDAQLVREATPLLSAAVAMLIEDEHLGALQPTLSAQEEAARGERLLRLGHDIAALALAIGVLVSRSAETSEAAG
jgi:hypothetical protein